MLPFFNYLFSNKYNKSFLFKLSEIYNLSFYNQPSKFQNPVPVSG